ncbi:MAG: hypothetical protein ACRDKW_06975 [Actinomycetota bacterium]
MQPSPGITSATGTSSRVVPDHAAGGPRLAPGLSTEPHVWWERRCPACGRAFGRTVTTCPTDQTTLRRVEVSLPFLWIG